MNNDKSINYGSGVKSDSVAPSIEITSSHAYHEFKSPTLNEVDVLEQLKLNLLHLSDLQQRLGFVMREITYLIKRD